TLDLHVMAWRINGIKRALRLDLDLEAYVWNRLGGKLLRVQRIAVTDQARIRLEQLAVGERHTLLRARFDREDADLENVLAGVFEQRRVARLAHNILVNAPRLVRAHQFGLDRPPVDLHGELLDLRPFRHGEQEGPFDSLVIRIEKVLLDRRGRQLVVNSDAGLVPGDFQRTELVDARRRNRPKARPGFGSGMWRRPRWRKDSVWGNTMSPMGFIDDNQAGRPRGTDRSEQQKQQPNPAFHNELDGQLDRMLRTAFVTHRVKKCADAGLQSY